MRNDAIMLESVFFQPQSKIGNVSKLLKVFKLFHQQNKLKFTFPSFPKASKSYTKQIKTQSTVPK